jgi:hypothetical protein
MAWCILRRMNFPTLVTAVEIDAAAGRVVTAQNCRVEGLKGVAGTGGTFQHQGAPLPFFPEEAKRILPWAPIGDDLNMVIKPEEIEVRRAAALRERLAKMPQYTDAIRRALVITPHAVGIVPVSPSAASRSQRLRQRIEGDSE